MENLGLLLVCSLLALSLFTAISGYTQADIKSQCSHTPYSQICEYHLSQAKDKAYSLRTKCRSGREKSALKDCLELYDDIVQKIQATVDPNLRCSAGDAQRWLSRVLVNLEICRDGFTDLGVTGNIFRAVTSHNVSYLIMNALALNKGFIATNNNEITDETTWYTQGFPVWLRPGDLKLLQSRAASEADIVVAQDGSGNYRTVMEGLNAAARHRKSGRRVIHVKTGVYHEHVLIDVWNIMLVGEGIGRTIITDNRSARGGSTILDGATVVVKGHGFIGQGVTIRNTAGPANEQAVALRSDVQSVFYQCSFEGYQDTIFLNNGHQFFRECDIYGTVDFIFGYSTSVFQNCNIYARNPPNKINVITAHGRLYPEDSTGISIHNCTVMAAPDLKGSLGSVKTYLGRPWKAYSRTVFMKSFLDSLIDLEGWLPRNNDTSSLNTLYYGEYLNTGPGASTANRVKWGGYHVITSPTEASKFTVENFIGSSWLRHTNVPFTPGL